MSGLPDIDIVDWERNTEYTGYTHDHNVVKVWDTLVWHSIMLTCAFVVVLGTYF